MRPRTTFSRKETMELLKRFLQSLALVLFMLAMLALGHWASTFFTCWARGWRARP